MTCIDLERIQDSLVRGVRTGSEERTRTWSVFRRMLVSLEEVLIPRTAKRSAPGWSHRPPPSGDLPDISWSRRQECRLLEPRSPESGQTYCCSSLTSSCSRQVSYSAKSHSSPGAPSPAKIRSRVVVVASRAAAKLEIPRVRLVLLSLLSSCSHEEFS